MSILYSILKPIVRKAVKGSSLHQEETYEEFKQASYDVQKKFKFALPKIKGLEFRDELLDGFHIIVGKEAGTDPDEAVVYFPGGSSPIKTGRCSHSFRRGVKGSGKSSRISTYFSVKEKTYEIHRIKNTILRKERI